jgi:hypothetical protein
MLHEKLWPFYDIKRMNKWSNHNTATSQAKPKEDLKLWCCPWEIMTTLGALSTK